MEHVAWRVIASIASVALLIPQACGEREAGPPGDGLTIRVAPVEYPQLEKVVYDLGVYTRHGSDYQLVWAREDIDSVGYGNGIGDITYIGPCDAQAQEDGWGPGCNDGSASTGCGCANPDQVSDCDAAGEKTGWVVIDIDEIRADGEAVPQSEWVNPCRAFGFGANADPTTADCVLRYLCEENADVLVEFNLTLMRDADQGFFDVIVEFEDVFCSAKFDTCYDDNPNTAGNEAARIRLLFRDDGQGGSERWDTGILAIACTGGPGADTNLYLDDVTLLCDGAGAIRLDPSQPEGGNVAAPAGQGIVFGYATYFGREELACLAANGSSASCKKKYWSVAIGFDTNSDHELGDDCTLYASATASDGAFGGTWVTPPKTRYPIIRFEVPLTPGFAASGDTTLACGTWGLDETQAGPVRTEYTSLECVTHGANDFVLGDSDDCDFCHRMNGIDPTNSDRPECQPTPPNLCGNGTCNTADGESALTCLADCHCGNGSCDLAYLETATTCFDDCHCGNGVCDPTETLATCATDCHCGDGVCDPTETASTCATDCHCGDGVCDPTETASTCATDCHCGDGVCRPGLGESPTTCLADCPFVPAGGDITRYCRCDYGNGNIQMTFTGCTNSCNYNLQCAQLCLDYGGVWVSDSSGSVWPGDCQGAWGICVQGLP